jgi:hypothetical protein
VISDTCCFFSSNDQLERAITFVIEATVDVKNARCRLWLSAAAENARDDSRTSLFQLSELPPDAAI